MRLFLIVLNNNKKYFVRIQECVKELIDAITSLKNGSIKFIVSVENYYRIYLNLSSKMYRRYLICFWRKHVLSNLYPFPWALKQLEYLLNINFMIFCFEAWLFGRSTRPNLAGYVRNPNFKSVANRLESYRFCAFCDSNEPSSIDNFVPFIRNP